MMIEGLSVECTGTQQPDHVLVTPQGRLKVIAANYRPEVNGTGPLIGDLCEWLAAHGSQVSILCGRPHYPDSALFPDYQDGRFDSQTVEDVVINRIPMRSPTGGGIGDRFVREVAAALRVGLRGLVAGGHRHETILSVCPSILMVAAASIHALGLASRSRRHVALIHDIQSGLASALGLGGGRALRVLQFLERWSLNRCDAIIVLTEEMAQQLRAQGVHRPFHVLPPPVDIELVQPMPKPAGPLKVLYSGNLGHKQSLQTVIDAAAIIERSGRDLPFDICGAGSQEAALRAQAQALNLTNLTFNPLFTLDRLSEGLATGDIHLVPQNPAGAAFALPSKVFSIMAAGRPFVAAASPDSPLDRLMQQSNAFLCVEPDNPEAMAAAILDLADDQEKRRMLGAAGRKYAVDHASHNAVMPQIAAVLWPLNES